MLRGIHLTIEAYSDVVENIFKEATDIVLNSTVSESIFKEVMEITYNEFKEKENSAPYQKAFMIFNKIVERNSTHYSENLKVINV
jgi:secreted Zn-dependent insulinase-like peptidase